MNRLGWIVAALVLVMAGMQFLERPAPHPSPWPPMSQEEFDSCGLYKLNEKELASLKVWVDRQSPGNPKPRRSDDPPPVREPEPKPGDPIVSFNVSTRKFHCPTCSHARACTRNCIELSRSEAIDRGGVACRTCGGTCN